MSAEENKVLIHRYIEEAWNAGSVDLLDELYDPGWSGGYGGISGMKAAIASYRHSFPDLHFTIEDIITEGDRICYRWTAQGTHQGDYDGIAPTGKPITVTGISMLCIRGGQIIDDQSESTIRSVPEQLGQK